MLVLFNKKKNILLLCPFFGIIVFIILYIIATRYYPGGAQFDKNSQGFSWSQNYWCNLLNERAINGQPNTARPIAMIALIILSAALSLFWIIFPLYSYLKKAYKRIVQISGLISQVTALFIFTSLHDILIIIATLFGLIAILGTFIILYRLKWRILFWIGIINILLILINNILYYGDGLIVYLPIIQKITFLYFLIWVSLVDIQLLVYARPDSEPPSPLQIYILPLL